MQGNIVDRTLMSSSRPMSSSSSMLVVVKYMHMVMGYSSAAVFNVQKLNHRMWWAETFAGHSAMPLKFQLNSN